MNTFYSRNFNNREVGYRKFDGIAQTYISVFMMGVLQCIRDGLSIKHGKDVKIVVTSGYRSKEVNSNTPGSATNSNHTWELTKRGGTGTSEDVVNIAKCAIDIKSPSITLEELFDYCKTVVRGEVYINEDVQVVHIAPCGPIKPPFRKRKGEYISDV